jgi:hypothetical protein
MELTAETYRDILRSLRSDPRSEKTMEKRTAPRVGLRSKLTITPEGGNNAVTWCRDLSINGIGLVHSEGLKIGQQFIAILPNYGQESLTVVYTVVNCRQLSKQLYSIGARLERVIDLKSGAQSPETPKPA